MRLPGAGSGVLLAGLMGGVGGVPGDTGNPLLGAWSATRWQYSRADGADSPVDVVADLQGMVTLSLGAGTWVLTWTPAGQASRTTGGTFEVQGEQLAFLTRGGGPPAIVRVRVGPDTLALHNESAAWDFDGTGREAPATLVAVFVRL